MSEITQGRGEGDTYSNEKWKAYTGAKAREGVGIQERKTEISRVGAKLARWL